MTAVKLDPLTFRSPPVQHLRRLLAKRSARWEDGHFVAEGPKLLDEALRAGARLTTVYVEAGAAAAHRSRVEEARERGAEVLVVAGGVLERALGTVTPQPLAAIVEMAPVGLDQIDPRGLTAVCAGIQDPGNAGTIVRSVAASGGRAVVFCSGAVDPYNPKTVRASAGAVFQIPMVCGPDPGAVLDHLAAQGVSRRGAVVAGGDDHDRVDWTAAVALVLGSESRGLPAEVVTRLDGLVTIPMEPGSESLNVAMAATVICFEAARQRRVAARTGA